MTVGIRTATKAEIPGLAAVLARAFLRDPMVTWPMVTQDDLEGRIRAMFELVDGQFAAQGWIHRTEDGAGVLSLIPPDVEDEERRIDREVNAAMAGLTPDGGARYAGFWSWIADTLPRERHWVLDQVAVEPAAQGRGVGTALIRFAIDRATADGLPLVLETSRVLNVGLYERFGFAVLRDAEAPGGGPRIWFMCRGPAD